MRTKEEIDLEYSNISAKRGHIEFQIDVARKQLQDLIIKQFELSKESDQLKEKKVENVQEQQNS